MEQIITLDNLLEFCEKNHLFSYDASKHENTMLIVHVPGNVENSISSKFAQETPEGLLPVTLQACHTELNRNGSYISEDTMAAALPSFKNRPILGHIIQKDDGTYDFSSHDMELVEDPWNKGEKRVHYIEQPIGTIPESCDAHLEYDDKKKKTYVVVNGWVYEDYGNGAAEILKEKGGTKVSVELGINKFSYNTKEKYLEIEDFIFLGVTALGEDIGEGMLGSNMIADFSNTQNKQEGGNGEMTLEDLLKKYNVTVDDLTFEVEGLDTTELEKCFKEAFADDGVDDGADDTTDDTTDNSGTDGTEESDTEETDGEDETESTDPEEGEESEEADTGEEDEVCEDEDKTPDDELIKKRQYTVSIGKKIYTFATSLDEVICALETLVNNTYAETDNTYYCVKVYDKYLVMVDCWTGKAYKQSYKVRNGSYSLTGDRIEVYARYLTQEEEQTLDEMRSKYAVIEKELQQYKASEEKGLKQELIDSNDYSLIKDSEEYQEVLDDIESYSLDSLKSKCDELLLNYVKSNGAFASKSAEKAGKKIRVGAKKEPEYSPYGTLFNEYK